ncbi:hypothetical protein V6957_004822 [Vibrio parahaemolyticus]|nr:hypothetical protein [Vibrio parahaemolyticus]EGQ8991589.1 hypothetical protein [Vibrio parahaemolyticus]EGQ9010769.1 hypothetical protein [Vibrio parahaemolyticus]EGR2870020.1 hypothetical protein [Vibrio parahaemolyticus]EGR2899809.1 hypothetical protein [Vibrio parahaemolyticus]
MAHFVDFEKMREKIFILNNVVLSGEAFAIKYRVGIEGVPSLYPKSEYWTMLKRIVSNSCLELSVLIRNSKELRDLKEGKSESHKIIMCADFIDHKVGKYDFMYIANKIIHAKSFLLTPVGSNQYEESFEWWDGLIEVSGTAQNGKDWSLSFNLSDWLGSIVNFLNHSQLVLSKIQVDSYDIQRSN